MNLKLLKVFRRIENVQRRSQYSHYLQVAVTDRGLNLHTVVEFKLVQCSSGGMFTAELYVSMYISGSWP